MPEDYRVVDKKDLSFLKNNKNISSTINKMPRSGRKVNWPETLEKYKQRISEFPDESWTIFENSYIGSFEIYSTVENIEPNSHMDCFAAVVLRLAREKGYNALGVTSVRKSNGNYICPVLLNDTPREEANIVYVGKYSYFSNHEKSIFAAISSDYIYM